MTSVIGSARRPLVHQDAMDLDALGQFGAPLVKAVMDSMSGQ
jgi:hypothetical protein